MPLAGIPQFIIERFVLFSGTAGSSGEVDVMGLQGQNGLTSTIWASSTASYYTITGPTTAGPIQVGVNGAVFAFNVGVSVQLPGYVLSALDGSQGWSHTP